MRVGGNAAWLGRGANYFKLARKLGHMLLHKRDRSTAVSIQTRPKYIC